MTTYKEIRGTNIEAVASDPSNPVEGQVWYNTTTNVVKGLKINPGSWATVNSMNTARKSLSGVGIQTAALAFGGQTAQALTESWNGTNWTETADLNTGRHSMGVNSAGTNNTSALTQGGTPGVSAATEEFSFVGGIQTIDTD